MPVSPPPDATDSVPAAVPVYERRDLPAELSHLRTMTELKRMRLKPADGQQPVAMVRVYRRGHGWGDFPLYDPAGAVKMRPLSVKQQRAMEARRTCSECAQVRDYVVYQRCEDCRVRAQQEAQDRQARTCFRCRREAGAALPRDPYGWPACAQCRIHHTLRHQAEAERLAQFNRTCLGPDCTTQIATDDEIAAARAAGTWRGPWRCPPCATAWQEHQQVRQREREEAERRAVEERAQVVRRLSEWAAAALADPDVVILDTETTGLHDEARIVDLGVLAIDGSVLMDTLLDPGEPIPREASDIHGITDDQVAGAPTFTDVLEQLGVVLAGKRVLIYNRGYDVERLMYELIRHYLDRAAEEDAQKVAATGVIPEGMQERAVAGALARAADWVDALRFEDVMIPYSEWVGEWSDYWGNYAWQPLYGGDHRALSDCRAVIDRLREMASYTTDHESG